MAYRIFIDHNFELFILVPGILRKQNGFYKIFFIYSLFIITLFTITLFIIILFIITFIIIIFLFHHFIFYCFYSITISFVYKLIDAKCTKINSTVNPIGTFTTKIKLDQNLFDGLHNMLKIKALAAILRSVFYRNFSYIHP